MAAPDDIDPVKVRDSLNVMCGPSISVHRSSIVRDDFNARFDARSRTYLYAILEGREPDPFLAPTTLHHVEPLDLVAMKEAAGHLLGPHDFASFGRPPSPGGSTERILYRLAVSRQGKVVRIEARANAFIQQMVRSLVGTLIQVGEGRRSPSEMPDVLAACDRGAAGPVVPPQGLCLVAVEYDDGWAVPPSLAAPVA